MVRLPSGCWSAMMSSGRSDSSVDVARWRSTALDSSVFAVVGVGMAGECGCGVSGSVVVRCFFGICLSSFAQRGGSGLGNVCISLLRAAHAGACRSPVAGFVELARCHANRAIKADGFAVQHDIFGDVFDECREFVGAA